MDIAQKQAFKKLIDTQIQILGNEIVALKAAVYPERGEVPSDKVAHNQLQARTEHTHTTSCRSNQTPKQT